MLNKELWYQYIRREIGREEFWKIYSKDNQIIEGYLLNLYKKALAEQSDDTLSEAGLMSAFIKDEPTNNVFMDTIIACLAGRWHFRHEDLVHYYKGLFREQDISILVALIQDEPAYLDYDETRQLARKSIYAIEAIKNEAALLALKELQHSEDEIVRDYVQEVMERNP
jgi:hypothetical protein